LKKIQFEVTEKDIEGYAGLSGDFNPIHLDREYAATHGFPEKVAHGMLTMAKVWGMIANESEHGLLPAEYHLTFQSPVYVGAQVELTIIEKENAIIITGKSEGVTVVKGSIVL
jgi:3-hydroxybutyryl-CoA dehydratase